MFAAAFRLAGLRQALGFGHFPELRSSGGFGFAVVEGGKAAAALADLLERRGEETRWPVRPWIQNSVRRENGILLSVSVSGEPPAGFIGFRRVASVDVMDDGFALAYSIRPDYVYVSPDSRGRGLSSAARDFVLGGIGRDIEALSSLWAAGTMQRIGDISLRFDVLGHAESDEGERFMESLRQGMSRLIADTDLAELGFGSVEPAF